MQEKGTQFHPSRDTRPREYDLGQGHEPTSTPLQGRLFDPERLEMKNRLNLGEKRFRAAEIPGDEFINDAGQTDYHPSRPDTKAEDIRDTALAESRIPTSHLQPRPKVMNTVDGPTDVGLAESTVSSRNQGGSWLGAQYAGQYTGPAMASLPDAIEVDPRSSHGPSTTFIHEAGHRQHLGALGGRNAADYMHHPRRLGNDPVKEGVADAYVDRYGGPGNKQVKMMQEDIAAGSKFDAFDYTGYSTHKDRAKGYGWNEQDRALYAASRAHAGETGEQPLYDPRSRHALEEPGLAPHNEPTIDATLHGLLSAGPHAAEALRNTGLEDVGHQAFRRHRDRQMLEEGQAIQHQLPGMGHVSHNQFGETPRTSNDVNLSLGVAKHEARKRGFPDS